MPTLVMIAIAVATPAVLALVCGACPLLAAESGETHFASIAALAAFKRGRGRPRKFAVPSRAVTLTLPESVIASLASVHEDLSLAVVALSQHRRRLPPPRRPPAELVVFRNQAVITIRPTPSLERRAGVHLVPLPDGRSLISFDSPQSIAELELTIDDSLEDPTLSPADRQVFEGINAILKDARRSKTITLRRRNIIVLESTSADGRHSATKSTRSRKG